MITNVVITNRLGFKYIFDDVNRLVDGLDLSGLQADVNFIQTNNSGSRYQNTRLRNRNIELIARLYKIESNDILEDQSRAALYRVVNPELNPMRIDFQTSDGVQYYVNANATSTPTMSPDRQNNNRAFQNVLIQFLCTDPYIYELRSEEFTSNITVGSNTGLEFDLDIPEIGITFEDVTNTNIIDFDYPGESADGFSVRFEAIGSFSNPRLINQFTGEQMRVNLAMDAGDTLEITTYPGNRSITYRTTGTVVNGFSFFDFQNSRFLSLNPGNNQFRYEVSSGSTNNLRVFINYRIRRVGL